MNISKNVADWSIRKRTVYTLLFLIVGLMFYWTIQIGLMYRSVDTYRAYWQQEATASGELTYVAFGDSAAQGIGASTPQSGYVGLIADRYSAATGKTVRVINLSTSGAKLDDVLRKQLPEFKKLNITNADLVTIEIGANDMRSYDEQKFMAEFKQITAELPDGTFVSDLPDYKRGDTREYGVMSGQMEDMVGSRPNLHFVPLGKATAGNQKIFGTYAYDFFHPNDDGYLIWADAFWSVIEPNIPKD